MVQKDKSDQPCFRKILSITNYSSRYLSELEAPIIWAWFSSDRKNEHYIYFVIIKNESATREA